MGTLRLWSDEVEAMRADARAAVDAGSAWFPRAEASDVGLTVEEKVARQRASHAQSTIVVPEGEERHIAGVRCRVFRPDTAPRACTCTSTVGE